MMAEGGVAVPSEEKTRNLTTLHAADKDELNESVNELAQGYSDYLRLDFSCEKQFSETVEDLLTKLDEYIGFADLIRSDVNLALLSTMSSIQTKGQEMQKHFDRIDRLEAFMMMVKKNVSEMEAAVEKAESDMGRLSSIKKVINSIWLPSIFTPKSQLPRPAATPSKPVQPKFEPVAIFCTDDYFKLQGSSLAETATSPSIGVDSHPDQISSAEQQHPDTSAPDGVSDSTNIARSPTTDDPHIILPGSAAEASCTVVDTEKCGLSEQADSVTGIGTTQNTVSSTIDNIPDS